MKSNGERKRERKLATMVLLVLRWSTIDNIIDMIIQYICILYMYILMTREDSFSSSNAILFTNIYMYVVFSLTFVPLKIFERKKS